MSECGHKSAYLRTNTHHLIHQFISDDPCFALVQLDLPAALDALPLTISFVSAFQNVYSTFKQFKRASFPISRQSQKITAVFWQILTRQLTAHLGLKRIRAALWSFARRSAALLQGAERGAGICDLSHIMPRHATSLLRVLSVPSFVFGIMHLTYLTCV